VAQLRIRSESSLEIADANAFGLASQHLHKIGIAAEPELRNQLRAWRVTGLRFAYAERGGGQQGERVIGLAVCYQQIVDCRSRDPAARRSSILAISVN
jgi:hypothetical protein